jgi:dolichyl-phosphate-mannose-protein mannosyltransferase
MQSFLKKSWPFLLLAILAFAIHLAFLSHPAQVVFDEVHFGKFVGAYFTGKYYFDIHPPMGKLLITGWAKLNGLNPAFDFDHIGETAPAHMFFVMRFLPAFFGGLFVLASAWLAWLISRSKKVALIAGLLILLDNAFLVQSRFILVDIFMLTFEALTFCFFFLYQCQKTYRAKWFLYLILSGIFFGLTISIKWTGLATIGIIGVILIAKIFSKKLADYLNNSVSVIPAKAGIQAPRSRIKSGMIKWELVKEALIGLIFLLVIGSAVYIIPFYIHFKFLPNSGPGDAFMNQQFQQELKYGRESVSQPLTFWQKFIELNQKMYFYNSTLKGDHPSGSRWYGWFLDHKPIYYWNQDNINQAGWRAKIYLIGNPLLWWLGAGFIIFTLFALFRKNTRRKLNPIFYILILGYFANLVPFIFVTRVSFLYHYFPSALFLTLLTSLWLAHLWPKEKKILLATMALILVVFIVLTPFSYGIPLPVWLDKFESQLISFFH